MVVPGALTYAKLALVDVDGPHMQTKGLREYRRVNPDILPEVCVSFLGVHRRALAGVKNGLSHEMATETAP